MQTADSLVAHAQAGIRFALVLISVFAIIAGVLAGVGLYGVLSTAVRQRSARLECEWPWGRDRTKFFNWW